MQDKSRYLRAAGFLLAVLLPALARAEDEGTLLGPWKVSVTPEIRSTYVSLGKIFEDRPMQVTDVHVGYDTGLLGVFGVRNWDVSSLTDRRADVHRHCLYHTEFGPYWHYDWKAMEGLTVKTGFTPSWTLYRGFEVDSANDDYMWYQLDQSFENSWLVPFWRLRRCVEGGDGRNFERVVGRNVNGGEWGWGVSSISFRLEAGWKISSWATFFAYVEQYDIVGGDARDTVDASTYLCAHNDWTHGGVGLRLRF